MILLEAKNLKKSYETRHQTIDAVKDVSLHIESGEILAFLGPNGAGKTTTIKMIAGLVQPDSGWVRIAGRDPYKESSVTREIGAVLEGNRNLYWRLTPEENLEYFGILRGLRLKEARVKGSKLLERFGLVEKRRTPVQTLSRGMQQKLAIAVSLIHSPRLLLLDEPTLGLDVEAAENVKQLIREIAGEGCAILLTTHQLEIAEKLSERVAIIRSGTLITEESTHELIKQFSGQSYAITIADLPSEEQAFLLRSLGVTLENDKILFRGDSENLWEVLDVVKPLPLIRIEQDNADLTGIFLKLVREESVA